MLKPVRHSETNADLGKPADWDDRASGECITLPVVQTKTRDGLNVFHSFYELNAKQAERLKDGYPIRLSIYSSSHPVISIDVRNDTGDYAID